MALSTTALPPIVPGSLAIKPGTKNTVVHPFDPVDTNADVWFPHLIGESSVRSPNEVIPYINGREAFNDVVSAIRTAKSSDHSIYLLGWLLLPDFPLIDGDPSTTIRALFRQASSQHVDIRVMLYRQQTSLSHVDNTSVIDFIQRLPRGKAIHDDRVVLGEGIGELGLYFAKAQYIGIHHQKILLVSGSEGLIAFQGGMDLNGDRLHFGAKGVFGLHDVQTRIRGVAALDLWDIFRERWSSHPESRRYAPLPSTLTTPDIEDDLQVQVGRTYPNSVAHPLYVIPPLQIFPELRINHFAPHGVQSAKAIVLNAIAQSKTFIYIEDQYLLDMDISNALKAALPHLKKLILLICDSRQVDAETHQPYLRRRSFINNLTGGAPLPTDKVIVCRNADGSDTIPYVHSKTFIFDDKFLVTGSANLTRRGYTYDSEQNAGIFDTNKKRRFYLAHEVRMHLWAKILNMQAIDLVDPIASSVHWTKAKGNITVYDINGVDTPHGVVEDLFKDLVWNNGLDPDGS